MPMHQQKVGSGYFSGTFSRIVGHFIKHRSVWSHLGWRDLQIRYASIRFGPWWSVANLLTIVIASSVAVGLLSGETAKSSVPKLALCLAIWGFLSASIVEATLLFEESRGLLLNSPYDELTMVFRLIWRNVLVFVHNLTVLTLVFGIFEHRDLIRLMWLFPLLPLFAVCLIFPVFATSKLVYWRTELRAIIPPLVQFLFFVTPVLWSAPDHGVGELITNVNPIAWILSFAESLVVAGDVEWSYLARVLIVAVVSFVAAARLSHSRYSIKKKL
jgi:ABC-2 type transport system permease protein